MSGVGISFGADRIYDVLEGLGKFPGELSSGADLLFANMGRKELEYVLPVASALRLRGVAVEIYPDASKLKKQFDYCDRKGIRFLSVCGENEAAAGLVRIKNLSSGEEKSFGVSEVSGIAEFIGI
jgi:histidyl-tRNA synthetase